MKLVLFLVVVACLVVTISAKTGGFCGGEVCKPLQRCVCDRLEDYDTCHCEGPL
ncbi:hypothetical protein AAVH_22507, partial [Aphelenchoides avenae]